ncbi:MAG: type IV pilus assembly protein PilX [Marinobacter sp. T13-3]|nr:MAG: type IV pilus assembly protein PilX [Marinobacter sp. T13-3]
MNVDSFPRDKQQNGAALILSLLLLLVLTLLALSSMEGSVMQQRMVSGLTEGMVSLEIAESGLRDAEEVLESINVLSAFDGTNGLYGPDDNPPDPLGHDWASSTVVRNADSIDGVTPRYFIQHMGDAAQTDKLTDIVVQGYTFETGALDTQAFRIVVWTGGVSGEAQRIIESYYARDI